VPNLACRDGRSIAMIQHPNSLYHALAPAVWNGQSLSGTRGFAKSQQFVTQGARCHVLTNPVFAFGAIFSVNRLQPKG